MKKEERQDKIIKTLIDLYNRGLKITTINLIENSGIPKKYLQREGIIPLINKIRSHLLYGEIEIGWLNKKVLIVGTGNILINDIDVKIAENINKLN